MTTDEGYWVGEWADTVPPENDMTITVELRGVRYTFKPDWGNAHFYRYPIVEEALTAEQVIALRSSGGGVLWAKGAAMEPDLFVALSAFGRNCEVTREVIDGVDA
jgi:hypothetical protein